MLREIEVPVLPLDRLRPVIGDDRHATLDQAAEAARQRLAGRTVWNISSTSAGGGVAEMLQVIVGYIRGAGIDIRWLVIAGDGPFFAVTKRLHNRIHGVAGDPGSLGPAEQDHYREVLAANASPLLEQVAAGDVVLLHDPQTAGLAEPLAAAGAHVVWRSHIGLDRTNEWTEEAWAFLRPHLQPCDAFVFSLQAYVPPWVNPARVAIIPPSIDPFSPKNQDIDPPGVVRALGRIGVAGPGVDAAPVPFIRRDGAPGRIDRAATVVAEDLLDPDTPLVVQVSRWDRLKDMKGVMIGFAERVVGRVDAELALVGPSVAGVTDDPEGAEVLAECTEAWAALPAEARRRVRLVTLPMDDIDENAAMVNCLQRHATVIVQKSLAEGFGLTVAEAMWKGRPVVASAVGGIVDQVNDGNGILLDDPADLDAFGDAVAGLLEHPGDAARLGEQARRHVVDHFVGDRHLERYGVLMDALLAGD